MILVGANHPVAFDYVQLQQRFKNPEIRNLLVPLNIETPGDLIASRYLFAEETLMAFSQGASTLNSDDRPILEFSARYNLGEKTLGEYAKKNEKALMNARQGKVYLPVQNFGHNPEEVSIALRQIGEGYARIGRRMDAETFMRKAAEVF